MIPENEIKNSAMILSAKYPVGDSYETQHVYGPFMNVEFNLNLTQYYRTTPIKSTAIGVTNVYKGVQHAFDGFIGIAPPNQRDLNLTENNYLANLVNQGIITHPCISFYITNGGNHETNIIKFG
jgi:hypothetical protein